MLSQNSDTVASTTTTSSHLLASSRTITTTRLSISLWPNGCYLPLPPPSPFSNRPLSANEIVLFQSLIPPLKIIVYNYAIPYLPSDVPIPSQWLFPIITRPPASSALVRIAKVNSDDSP
jgi:hypothetical protein